MRIKRVKPQSVKASTKRKIRADEEIMEEEVMDAPVEDEGSEGAVSVDPEATDLLFEAEDVAELVAEVTGEEVAVTVDDDAVTFEVGEDVFTVEPEGDEEILEATKKPLKGKKSVRASKAIRRRRPAARRR